MALRVDDKSLTIFVNHFKSKRGGVVETAPRRLAQARHVNDLVRDRLAVDPEAEIIVLGDFNDYNLSSVWQRLQDAGVLHDAMQQVSANDRYSYIFDGASQLVDGILVSPALVHRIESVNIAHVNADHPYSLALDVSPAGLPFHASDHDPVLLTIYDPSYSQNTEIITVERLQSSPAPIITARPTAVSTVDAEPSLTPLLYGKKEPEDSTGLILYVLIIGLAILLAAMAVFWLVRRASH